MISHHSPLPAAEPARTFTSRCRATCLHREGGVARWLSSSSTARPPERPLHSNRSLLAFALVVFRPMSMCPLWPFSAGRVGFSGARSPPRQPRCHWSPCVPPPSIVVGRMEVTRGGDTNSPFPFQPLINHGRPSWSPPQHWCTATAQAYSQIQYKLSPVGKEGRWGPVGGLVKIAGWPFAAESLSLPPPPDWLICAHRLRSVQVAPGNGDAGQGATGGLGMENR